MQTFALIALIAQTAAASPPVAAEVRGEALMDSLRAGGYTILLRHTRTDRSFREEMGAIPAERSAQRNLTDEGVQDAKIIGAVLKQYDIPIGEIIASPMFRTRETAELAAGPPTIAMALRSWPSTDEQAALVAAAPPAGTNRLLVTHHFVLETHVPGIRPGDIGESEAAVIARTPEGRVRLLGRIALSDWERLAGIARRASPAAAGSSHHGGGVSYGTSGPLATLPDTPAGRLAARYLDAFNSGDPTRVRSFIDSALVADPERPTDARVRTFEETFGRLGAITPVAIHRSAPDELALVAHANGGEYLITIRVSAEHAGRAASIVIAAGASGGRHP